MTIRTIEEHDALNKVAGQRFKTYIPVGLAYLMPLMFRKICDSGNLRSERGCKKEIEVVQRFLDDNFEMCTSGFARCDSDGDRFTLHRCTLTFRPNVRTFCEANSGIDGKPSIGISFKDADDSYNDWIWVAVDVIRGYDVDGISRDSLYTDEMKTMYDCIVNRGDVESHSDEERAKKEYGFKKTIEEKNARGELEKKMPSFIDNVKRALSEVFSDYRSFILSWWSGEDATDKVFAMLIVALTAVPIATFLCAAFGIVLLFINFPLKAFLLSACICMLYPLTKWLASKGRETRFL